ncbi:MAG: hypothetical protein J6P45_09390 [Lachnospiraceae bacterium]|nr:hypothetical protein [Lachnospiraceae bacterium]
MLRIGILLISVWGYFVFYRIKLKLSPYFFPISFISFASIIVYLGGLCNRLKDGGYAVIIIGLLAGAFGGLLLIKSRKTIAVKSIIREPALWFLIISVIWAYVITGTMTISHADDFGHWYRLCKIMNYDGGFIDAPDLEYRTYVPGTAVWIFFVTRFIGFSIHKCFFSQSLIYIACGTACFCIFEKQCVDREKLLGCMSIAIGFVISLTLDVGVYELLVDAVVATVAFTELLLVARGKGRGVYLQFLLIMSFAALIKTSSILFCFFTVIVWAIKEGRKLNEEGESKAGYVWFKAIVTFAVPIIFSSLYKLSLNYYHKIGNSAGNQHFILEKNILFVF